MRIMPLLFLKCASRSVTAIRAAVLDERRRRRIAGARDPKAGREVTRRWSSGRRSVAWRLAIAFPRSLLSGNFASTESRSVDEKRRI
jgi:hypothetical protein